VPQTAWSKAGLLVVIVSGFGGVVLSVKCVGHCALFCRLPLANLRVHVTLGDQGFFESCGVLGVNCVSKCHGFNPTRVTLVLARPNLRISGICENSQYIECHK